jgi:nucleoside-diphosphate kinase
MLECKHRRKHLARIAFPHLAALDVRPGAKLVIFGRQYRVEDYEDKHTRDALARAQATTVALVTPQGMPAFGRVWAAAEASGLRVVAARQVALSGEDAAWACSHLAAPLSGPGAVLALQFLGEDAEAKVGALGAHLEAAGMPRGALCCARAGAEAAVAELSAGFFGPPAARRPSARGSSSASAAADAADAGASAACVLVLPHALLAGAAGSILAELCGAMDRAAAAGCPPLTVAACRMVDLSRGQAEEFLEVYKDVVPEYAVSARRARTCVCVCAAS